MNKLHHPSSRLERIKLREKKTKDKHDRDIAGHVQRRLAVEQLKAEEARYEIEQVIERTADNSLA